MREDVLICVKAREDFFEKYYSVPEEMKGEVSGFIGQLRSLGESSDSVASFEDSFIKTGLSDKLTSLITRCTPKPQNMTAEEKQYSDKVAKDIYEESGRSIAKEVAADVVDSIDVEVKEEAIAQGRKAMIESGVFDDYTKATNVVEDAGLIFGFLKKKFGKKKDKE